MRTRHFAVFGRHTGGSNEGGKVADRIRGEQPVGADADESKPRPNTAKYVLCILYCSAGPSIHGPQNGEIRVRVKPLDESFSLVIEVAGNIETAADQPSAMVVEAPRVLAIPVGIAGEPLIEQSGRLVAEHPDLAG